MYPIKLCDMWTLNHGWLCSFDIVVFRHIMGSYHRNCRRGHPVVSDCLCSGRIRRHLKENDRSSRSWYFIYFNTVLSVGVTCARQVSKFRVLYLNHRNAHHNSSQRLWMSLCLMTHQMWKRSVLRLEGRQRLLHDVSLAIEKSWVWLSAVPYSYNHHIRHLDKLIT